jgi:hypothetical protein
MFNRPGSFHGIEEVQRHHQLVLAGKANECSGDAMLLHDILEKDRVFDVSMDDLNTIFMGFGRKL